MARLKDIDGTPAWRWNKKASSVNVANLNSNIIQYLDKLPQSVQDRILATSGNDSVHLKTSRHYSNSAIDLRYDDEVWKHIEKDPNRLKYGLTLLDPDHGSAKHIHLSYGDGKENHNDVWMNPYSDEAKKLYGTGITPSTTPITSSNSIPAPIQGDETQRLEYLKLIKEQMDIDYQSDLQQKQLIAREEHRQQQLVERVNERNRILDAIKGNNLEFQGRNYKPNQNFAKGGEVESLDDDLDFIIDNLKADVPEIQSQEYLSLVQENSALQNKMSRDMEIYNTMLSNLNQEANTNIPELTPQGNIENSIQGNSTGDSAKISKLPQAKSLIYSELKNLGLNNVQIAGAIGSLGGESGEHLDSTVFNQEGSGAFGIAQWLGPRYRSLIKFSEDNGLNYKTPEAQAKFLAHELKGTHKSVLNKMLKTNSISEAAEVWTRKFEIPSEREIRGSMSRRINFAQNFFNSIS